jgi:hypothetical protein
VTARRFPPPWSIETQDACFIVRDRDGQALAYIYFRGRTRTAFGGEIIDGGRGAAHCGEYC